MDKINKKGRKKLKLVFMGTPDFACESLQQLNEHFEVVSVVTSPDQPAGRGLKVQSSAVKKLALNLNLPVLTPISLKDEFFLKELASFNADVFVVVAFKMLPNEVWKMPKMGTINLHASLLPQYRGAAPINWAIIKGEKKTGLTTFFIEEKMDTGLVLAQTQMHIQLQDNA
jgi:methionyl-tRNA formyltransferase